MIEQGAFQTLPSHFQYQKGIYALVKYHLSFYSQPLIVCRYFIYGMQDSQNLERVVLAFDKFDIPYGRMDRFQQLEQ